MAWSLQRYYGHENFTAIEWQITAKIPETELVCPFVAEMFVGDSLRQRISGKAIYLNNSIQLIINNTIQY